MYNIYVVHILHATATGYNGAGVLQYEYPTTQLEWSCVVQCMLIFLYTLTSLSVSGNSYTGCDPPKRLDSWLCFLVGS